MRSVNKVIIIGNLTRDAVVKDNPSGASLVLLGVATNRNFTTRAGEKKSTTEFHECCSFQQWIVKLAQSGALTKGKQVYIEGYLKTRSWEDEAGKRIYRTEIAVEELIILEKRRRGDGGDDEDEDDMAYDHSSDDTTTFSDKKVETASPSQSTPDQEVSMDDDLF